MHDVTVCSRAIWAYGQGTGDDAFPPASEIAGSAILAAAGLMVISPSHGSGTAIPAAVGLQTGRCFGHSFADTSGK